MANAAIKKMQARNIAKKLASGEITEGEAQRLRAKRGIRSPNDAQKYQAAQNKSVSDIGAILNATGAGVRAEDEERQPLDVTEGMAGLADRHLKRETGYSLADTRLVNSVARQCGKAAAQDEDIILGNALYGAYSEGGIDTDNAGRR